MTRLDLMFSAAFVRSALVRVRNAQHNPRVNPAASHESAVTFPAVAVVVPMRNEADNVRPLLAEICAALTCPFEIVVVDDGSDDSTAQQLALVAVTEPRLRIVRHKRPCGQSAAVLSGVRAARASIVATLDGDGQNDPADIPKLVAVLQADSQPELLLVAGWRKHRRDPWSKRVSSRLANAVRRALLHDATPDSGCGLKVFTRAAFLELPWFDHGHRFLPALMLRRGGRVQSVVVNHRPRERGTTKYGVGNRLFVGLTDLFGVLWLRRRARNPDYMPPHTTP